MMKKGFIYSYNPVNNYGFVRDCLDDCDYYFHTRDLRFNKEEVEKQMPVIFNLKWSKNGEKVIATNIEKCV